MTRVIVICAGEGERWGDHLGVPKHLIEIDGERLIDRTVRLAREHGASEVLIAAKRGDKRYDVPGARRVMARLNPDMGDADKFLSSRHLWDPQGRTVVVYGDVYFTPEAMRAILTDDHEDWRLYARFGPSKITGATAGECFAVSAYPQHHEEWTAALHRVAALWREGKLKRCGGWETYRAMHNLPADRLGKHRKLERRMWINDWTEDFDKPDDYDKWIARRNVAKVAVLMPWRADGSPERERNRALVTERWRTLHPDWDLVEGTCPDGPWVKALAVRDALAQTDAQTLILADADVWCSKTVHAVAAVQSGTPWAVPHLDVHRLTQAATQALADGRLPWTALKNAPTAQRPYTGVLAGGLTVISRALYTEAPLDPRFAGWGQEDEAAGHAWRVLAGKPWRGFARLYHLWHEPQARLGRVIGSPEGKALRDRYRTATTPEDIQALIAEG